VALGVFTFLIGGLCWVKLQMDGDILKITDLKKILVLRTIIPRYGFSMIVNCGYTMPSKYSMKFLGVHLGTYYIGRVGWKGVVLSIQPHKPTCLLWFFSKHIPQILTRTHSKKIPWENVQKTR